MIVFGVALPAATAWSASNADCVGDAVRVIPKVNSPATLHDSFLAFRGCDDGAVSKLFTDAVTNLLALQWASVSQMQALAATEPPFKEFVLKHIDATTAPEILRRIAFNAQHYCPDRSQSFCVELRQAAESVLRGLPTAASSANEETPHGDFVVVGCERHCRYAHRDWSSHGRWLTRGISRSKLESGMAKRVERPAVRSGYDRWSEAYDYTPNPLVALDRRHTIDVLNPHREQTILDAGCGTGAHLTALAAAGSRPVGLDFSRGMLRVARRKNPHLPLAQADLNQAFPVKRNGCDAVLCALVSEHLTNLRTFFLEALAVLKRGGRFVFSAFHPELAAAGIEANFEQNGVEYRLGAERYTVSDYLNHMDDVGFEVIRCRHFRGDSALVEEVPGAIKYMDRPLLLIIEAVRPTRSAA